MCIYAYIYTYIAKLSKRPAWNSRRIRGYDLVLDSNINLKAPSSSMGLEFRAWDDYVWLVKLGFGVPYFNTFFLNGTLMKYKFIPFFLSGYLKAQKKASVWVA